MAQAPGRKVAWLLLTIYSVFLLLTTTYIAVYRHLWFDEVDTSFIGTLPSLHAIWNNLLLGTDGQPIGFYVPVHLFYVLFGSSSLAIRLCAIIPFWLTTLLLYYAVARRTSALYGLVAALMPAFTVAFQYSFEARPYALVLFFCVCSFIAWQFAKENRMRVLSAPAIGIALAAAICVHYNAVLLVFPLLAGEAVYTIRSRKIDVGVLLAICLSGLPLLFLLPHIHAIHAYSKSYWSHSNFSTLSDIYFALSAKLLVLGFIGCVGFGLWAALSMNRIREIRAELSTIPAYEMAAAGSYLLLPIACFVLSLYTKALHYRYVIATVIGFAIFIPFTLWIFRNHLRRLTEALCILMALSLIYTAMSRMRTPDEDSWGTYASYSELFDPRTKAIYNSDKALVLGDGPFLVAAKYGAPALRQRLFYPVDRKNWNRNSPVVFRGLRNVVPGPFQLVALNQFEREHHSFLMYDPESWIYERLIAEGDNVRVIADLEHNSLYEVTLK